MRSPIAAATSLSWPLWLMKMSAIPVPVHLRLKAVRHRLADRLDPDCFVGGVGAGLAVELAHILTTGMVQADHLPVRRLIEDRAAGTARLRRRAIVDEAPLRQG